MARQLLLKQDPTLNDLQQYVAQAVQERGFDKDSVEQRFMLLIEEGGEFAKAARSRAGTPFADDTKTKELAHEAGDVLNVLLGICRDKEAINQTRPWK
ncbi:MAG: MazG nucleotide pyrophosphohydrolase domain-containing protein [Candidatus Saccharimonadales bacterium]